MIDSAIGQIAGQLNLVLQRQFQVGEDLVVVSNLHEQDGTMAQNVANKLVVFLVNIERETVQWQGGRANPSGARVPQANPPIHLNLMVMFAANFGGTTYLEALKFIASTVSFFQARPVFDHRNTPELDARIDKLTLEIENLNVADLSNLWGVLSGKYLPSVLYRMRMVSIDASQITALLPRVDQPEVGVHA